MKSGILTEVNEKTVGAALVNTAVSHYRGILERHVCNFGSETVQQALNDPQLAIDVVDALTHRIDSAAGIIVRRTRVKRTLDPESILGETNRLLFPNGLSLEHMPRGQGDVVEVSLFKVGRIITSMSELVHEYEKRGLEPADPYSLTAVNRDNPALSDKKTNCTHWQGLDGKWWIIQFGILYVFRSEDRYVAVNNCGCSWDHTIWFAGIPHSATVETV
ncbi:MAG: hypothetical protein P4L87_20295 [Formivibrio sp.]|nr:hypothetical protein [Formivibrio sp.]